MKINLEALKKLKNTKSLPALIILVIISAVLLNACKNLWSANMRLKDEIAKKTQEIAKGANSSSLKKKVSSEIKEAEGKLSSIEDNFPSSNIEEVFSSLNRFIENSRISLKAISPLEKTETAIPGSQDKYLELPIDLKFECSYDQLVSFLKKIENSNKLMIVTDVEIQSNPGNIWEHNIELSLKVPMLALQPRSQNK